MSEQDDAYTITQKDWDALPKEMQGKLRVWMNEVNCQVERQRMAVDVAREETSQLRLGVTKALHMVWEDGVCPDDRLIIAAVKVAVQERARWKEVAERELRAGSTPSAS